MKRLEVLLAAAFASCALILAQGCASTDKTTTVTTTTHVNGGAVTSQAVPGDTEGDPSSSNAPSATTTTTTTQSNEPDSVLGATLHLVGTIILLPFRIVGDVLGAIV